MREGAAEPHFPLREKFDLFRLGLAGCQDRAEGRTAGEIHAAGAVADVKVERLKPGVG